MEENVSMSNEGVVKDKSILMRSFLLLAGVGTSMAWAEDDSAALIAGIGMTVFAFLFLFWFVVTIFFVLSQNKLVDAYAEANNTQPISKIWTWTQLIPLWSIVALLVSIIKFSEEKQNFKTKYGVVQSQYNPILGWSVVGAWFFSMIIPFIGIVAFPLWIVYWVNVSSASKSVLQAINNNS